jgi:hypothetical protein
MSVAAKRCGYFFSFVKIFRRFIPYLRANLSRIQPLHLADERIKTNRAEFWSKLLPKRIDSPAGTDVEKKKLRALQPTSISCFADKLRVEVTTLRCTFLPPT